MIGKNFNIRFKFEALGKILEQGKSNIEKKSKLILTNSKKSFKRKQTVC